MRLSALILGSGALFVLLTHTRLPELSDDVPLSLRTFAGVTINVDSARSIEAKLGHTRSYQGGSGHDVFRVWCYRGTDRTGALVELMSDASDMGTDAEELNVIRVRAANRAPREHGCRGLPRATSTGAIGALTLGMTRAAIERAIGAHGRVSGDSLVFEYEGKEPMQPGSADYAGWNTPERRKECFEGGAPYVSIGASVIVLLTHSHAVELRVERYDQATC